MFRPIISLAILLLATFPTFADSFLPPCPYVVKSADGTKHFVMLTKQTEMECRGRSEADSAAAKALRIKYKSSGVYENGDPEKPIWTFNEEWWLGRVLVANDGSHIVKMGVLGSSTSAEAFTIYKDGKTIRSYKVDELVRDESAANYTTSMIHWSKDVSLDDRNSRFNVETNDGLSYSIDLNTGEIVGDSKAPSGDRTGANTADVQPGGRFCFGAFIFLGLAGFLTFSRRRR